ncbi:DNA-binding response regulator [Massilia eurypsychrophila]|uniref:DNA-binding response regulator n=1 Tax=Massilia eurypsychrophila TaxID=1485217 RepID=A0A2G8T9B9_9BURK|nr:response regulator transcription factor [Massilia eurypsychrophila]PIL42650.1 DNA-binding response regulator [Massilia eurypsychrophila]
MHDKETAQLRVLLADDHPIVMSGFALSLQSKGIEVIGQVTTPNEAVEAYGKLKPDVLMMDLRFGEKLTGLDAAKTILERDPKANILFLSQFDQDALIKQTYSIGGRGFLTKDISAGDLAQAVADASRGETYFLDRIAKRLANLSVKGDQSPGAVLDAREFEIFLLTAKGRTNQEMAELLGLSQKTISNVTHALKEKLGTNRNADLTLLAVKHGYVEP